LDSGDAALRVRLEVQRLDDRVCFLEHLLQRSVPGSSYEDDHLALPRAGIEHVRSQRVALVETECSLKKRCDGKARLAGRAVRPIISSLYDGVDLTA
jgi:hypothetical protein